MSRRYAEDTKVPVGQSTGEVCDLLRKHGADSTAVYQGKDGSAVGFQMGGRMYKMSVPVNPEARDPEQDERRAWRLLLLLVKAKLEAVREGATTVEREFLADTVLYDGRTVAEWAEPAIERSYRLGVMPRLPALEGPK